MIKIGQTFKYPKPQKRPPKKRHYKIKEYEIKGKYPKSSKLTRLNASGRNMENVKRNLKKAHKGFKISKIKVKK